MSEPEDEMLALLVECKAHIGFNNHFDKDLLSRIDRVLVLDNSKTGLKRGDWVTHKSADGHAVRCVYNIDDDGKVVFFDQIQPMVREDQVEKIEDGS
jgi:hypothetical protein